MLASNTETFIFIDEKYNFDDLYWDLIYYCITIMLDNFNSKIKRRF